MTAAILVALTALTPPVAPTDLDEAQRLFYNGRYDAAEELTSALCTDELERLAACELRSSTLLFQIKRVLSGQRDKNKALKQCSRCAGWIAAFKAVTLSAQRVARARLEMAPQDHDVRFLLGKVDLNYVWLQLGVLGHKTGWSEYWEARRSLDAVLKQDPDNVRARVARAWIDYIVDTQMARGTRWVLGGGNKKRGLATVRDAAALDADPFVRAEAGFALWDMQVREGETALAVESARALARDFPDNEELQKFLAASAAHVSQ
ncbi:MAG TPA: hypothetical protein VN654_27805 [Vicinamibacterales bacterium]|jgi:tetratricopeptide (TPR) repeat protein|nr:hypothetical protein [Vicinamibacterales bacterium]